MVAFSISLFGCATDPENQAQNDYYEGVAFDEDNPDAFLGGGADDGWSYDIPTDLPTLIHPEIVVSLEGLTLHLFDRTTGFSEVYPVGVGVLGSSGRSITPTGHFATGSDTTNTWWYTARRWSPSYFGGFPFIRLTIENSRGANTYGIHGPITSELIRGYVSHGCMRMRGEDAVRVFYLIRNHPSTPVTIQQEVEIDDAGNPVDVGTYAVVETSDEPPPTPEEQEVICADCRAEQLACVAEGVEMGQRPWEAQQSCLWAFQACSWQVEGCEIPCDVDGLTGDCIEASICEGEPTPGFCPGSYTIQCCL